jgi:hypothetical protein
MGGEWNWGSAGSACLNAVTSGDAEGVGKPLNLEALVGFCGLQMEG